MLKKKKREKQSIKSIMASGNAGRTRDTLFRRGREVLGLTDM